MLSAVQVAISDKGLSLHIYNFALGSTFNAKNPVKCWYICNLLHMMEADSTRHHKLNFVVNIKLISFRFAAAPRGRRLPVLLRFH